MLRRVIAGQGGTVSATLVGSRSPPSYLAGLITIAF